MKKQEKIIASVVGFLLGMMALLLLSYSRVIGEANKAKELKTQEAVNLVEKARDVCSEEYPVVRMSIFRGKIVIECRTE